MNRGVLRAPLSVLAILLLLATPFLAGATALPNVHPPGTTVEVGEVGTLNGMTYAYPEGGVAVAPASTVTLVADYGFVLADGPASGETYFFVAHLVATGDNGPIGSANVAHFENAPGDIEETGTLEVELQIPETATSIMVTLSTTWHISRGQQTTLMGDAVANAQLTIGAIPEPVPFLTEDVVVGESLHAGEFDLTATTREVDIKSGHTFVSTELGSRFVASARVERPEATGMSDMHLFSTLWMTVSVEGGPSYSTSRAVFSDHCTDWANHDCGWDGRIRDVELEVVLPVGALGPRSVVSVHLHASHELQYYSAPTNDQYWEFTQLSEQGRHVVIGA